MQSQSGLESERLSQKIKTETDRNKQQQTIKRVLLGMDTYPTRDMVSVVLVGSDQLPVMWREGRHCTWPGDHRPRLSQHSCLKRRRRPVQPSAYPPLQGNEVWPWCLCTFFMTHRYAHRIYTAKPEPGQLYVNQALCAALTQAGG